MPRTQQQLSYTKIRMLTEKLRWVDENGVSHTGNNVPPHITQWEHVPFHLRCITKTGEVMEGDVVCIAVDTRKNMRKVKFVKSNEIRYVYDILIDEIDGIRIIAH